jgi:hypothetical protein
MKINNNQKKYFFSFSIIFGIIIARIAGILDTLLQNPNPIYILDVEMHHFYYGLIILIIALPLIIYLKKNTKFIIVAGFGFGVMLDDLILIMKLPYIQYQNINTFYMNTYPFSILIILIFLFIGIYYLYLEKK